MESGDWVPVWIALPEVSKACIELDYNELYEASIHVF